MPRNFRPASLHFIALTLAGSLLADANAASIDKAEYQNLLSLASKKNYVRVLVDLDIDVSLAAASKRAPEQVAKLEAKTKAVLGELGSDALQTGMWKNGLGQIGIYVTSAGLKKLVVSTNARRFMPDANNSARNSDGEGVLD